MKNSIIGEWLIGKNGLNQVQVWHRPCGKIKRVNNSCNASKRGVFRSLKYKCNACKKEIPDQIKLMVRVYDL